MLPCSLEVVSVVILAEIDFMIAVNNGAVSHYITVHVPGDFQTSKAYLEKKPPKLVIYLIMFEGIIKKPELSTKNHILHPCKYVHH